MTAALVVIAVLLGLIAFGIGSLVIHILALLIGWAIILWVIRNV